jgi:hypothetical protein
VAKTGRYVVKNQQILFAAGRLTCLAYFVLVLPVQGVEPPAATSPSRPGKAEAHRKPPIALVSAAKYQTLQEALDKERYLYIPPGQYTAEKPITIRGWRGGVIIGAGRFTTTLSCGNAEGRILRIADCKDVLIANLTFQGGAYTPGRPYVEIVGPASSTVDFAGVTMAAGQVANAQKRDGAIALRVAAPGEFRVQGCHFNQSAVGLEVADPRASVSVMGGNFQTDLVHIRQISGRLQARSIGFQTALDGADVEIQSRSAAGSHIIEACRTEGTHTLLRVPDTAAKVDVALKANSLQASRLVFYGGCGALVLAGNSLVGQLYEVGVEAPASSGPCAIHSYGNTLGNSFDARGAFALGAAARAFSAGDLWNVIKPGAPYIEPGNRLIGRVAYQEAGHALPGGLTFADEASGGFDVAPNAPAKVIAEASQAYQPVRLPRIGNLGDLVTSVKQYGAVGDGKTDDSAALSKAVAAERHKPLYFPKGRYLLKEPLFIHHWLGAAFWGEGADESVLVGSGGQSAFKTNSCGYTAFAGLGFEISNDAEAAAFDLNWDNSNAPDAGGAALQANIFYGCRFQGGVTGLDIGNQGHMGSENLLVGCQFHKSVSALGINNYNALSNTALGCAFTEHKFAVRHEAGSFNLYGCVLDRIAGPALRIQNSAGDTFAVNHVRQQQAGRLVETGHSSAVINLLVEGCRGSDKDKVPTLVSYASGGSVIVWNCDLLKQGIDAGGGIAVSTLVLVESKLDDMKQAQAGGRAKGFATAESK